MTDPSNVTPGPWRYADPALAMTRPTAIWDRFRASFRIDPDGCWRWTAGKTGSGYGAFYPTEQQVGAHVWSYRTFAGPIAEGMAVDHLCHTKDVACQGGDTCPHRACVNPVHLELTTLGDNVLRSAVSRAGANKRKTHCIRNHPLSGDNLVETVNSRNPSLPPYRSCRTCNNERRRERRAQRSA